jgi:RecB family exonuclease
MSSKEIDENYTSFSRLQAFKRCPQYYKLKYWDKMKEEKQFIKRLELGNLAHHALAEYLDETYSTKEDSFYYHLGAWLDVQGIHNFDSDELIESIKPATDLLWRASEKCRNPELMIRKENGQLLSDPTIYPTKQFKNLCNEQGITEKFAQIDESAGKENRVFNEESLSWFIAKAFYFVLGFEIPWWIEKTLHVEVGISTSEDNCLPLPETGTNFKGYIDWVVKTCDEKTLVIDHKTSKKKPSAEEVFLHPQLNLYAWAYEEIFGKFPELIGINHLESGDIVMVRTDRRVTGSVIKEYSELQTQISKGITYKWDPLDYGTPCIERDYKTNRIREVCPFLSTCHPIFYNIVSSEL